MGQRLGRRVCIEGDKVTSSSSSTTTIISSTATANLTNLKDNNKSVVITIRMLKMETSNCEICKQNNCICGSGSSSIIINNNNNNLTISSSSSSSNIICDNLNKQQQNISIQNNHHINNNNNNNSKCTKLLLTNQNNLNNNLGNNLNMPTTSISAAVAASISPVGTSANDLYQLNKLSNLNIFDDETSMNCVRLGLGGTSGGQLIKQSNNYDQHKLNQISNVNNNLGNLSNLTTSLSSATSAATFNTAGTFSFSNSNDGLAVAVSGGDINSGAVVPFGNIIAGDSAGNKASSSISTKSSSSSVPIPSCDSCRQKSKGKLCKSCRTSEAGNPDETSNTKKSNGKSVKKGNWGIGRFKRSNNNKSSSKISNMESNNKCGCNTNSTTSSSSQNTNESQNVAAVEQNPLLGIQYIGSDGSPEFVYVPPVNESASVEISASLLQRAAFYSSNGNVGGNVIVLSVNQSPPPLWDFSRFNPDDYPIEDCDERARIQRAVEIAEGVEPPPGFCPTNLPPTTPNSSQQSSNNDAGQQPTVTPVATTTTTIASQTVAATPNPQQLQPQQWHMLCTPDSALQNLLNSSFVLQNNVFMSPEELPRIHSQVDYIHCLVPDLEKITSCSFYWGKMDRYEAERLLDGKPEGTFLLRDSAQEEFLFSVSFRKYSRSLHARIEQFNHKFSFDSHDPGVYTASTVTGLLEHYKDPTCVMFFEPMLTIPLNRNFTFSLQQLCRATIVSHSTYDGINDYALPSPLKSYLKEYHYKQRVRVRRFDEHTYVNS